MGKPAGRRTVPVRVLLSPAEFEAWEALRAADVLGVSRADWVMNYVWREMEEVSERPGSMRERCRLALDALAADEDRASHVGFSFRERGGRPPHVAMPPQKEIPRHAGQPPSPERHERSGSEEG